MVSILEKLAIAANGGYSQVFPQSEEINLVQFPHSFS